METRRLKNVVIFIQHHNISIEMLICNLNALCFEEIIQT